MNRIVREDYPVSQLPEDLRDELSGQQRVTVTVSWRANEPSNDMSRTRPNTVKSLEELFTMAEPTFKSLDEVTAQVRSLRDDWT